MNHKLAVFILSVFSLQALASEKIYSRGVTFTLGGGAFLSTLRSGRQAVRIISLQ